jgi:hypothetical protein
MVFHVSKAFLQFSRYYFGSFQIDDAISLDCQKNIALFDACRRAQLLWDGNLSFARNGERCDVHAFVRIFLLIWFAMFCCIGYFHRGSTSHRSLIVDRSFAAAANYCDVRRRFSSDPSMSFLAASQLEKSPGPFVEVIFQDLLLLQRLEPRQQPRR